LLTTIDHLVITVDDLSSAVEDYTKVLGFLPTWRGEHPEMGTENALFPLQNTYLELMAVKGDGLYADIVKTNLKNKGEGLFGMVLGTEDLEAFKNNLIENGIKTGEISEGKGFEPNLNLTRTWKNLFLDPLITRDLFVFPIEHTSGELPSIEEDTSHVNRLDATVINTNDPDGFISLYRDKFGIRLALDKVIEQWKTRILFFRINKTTIEVINKENQEEKVQDSLWGLSWAVEDIKAAHERLVSQGVEVTNVKDGIKPKTLVCSIKSHTRGVPTLLIQHLQK
tara:strand:- start:1071 stop:1916 length:846 start_codon:yes stop_codon:yes gene_type:complete